jgi:hypothetical protein
MWDVQNLNPLNIFNEIQIHQTPISCCLVQVQVFMFFASSHQIFIKVVRYEIEKKNEKKTFRHLRL